HAPHPSRVVLAGDVLVVEADADALPEVLSTLGAKLEEDVRREDVREEAREQGGDGRADAGDEVQAPEPRATRKRSDPGTEDDGRPGIPSDRDGGSGGRGDGHAGGRADDEGGGEDEDEEQARARRDAARTPHADIVLQEIAVLPNSALAGRSATGLGLRSRYSINVLAISRAGHRSRRRLRSQLFQEGDLLLVQGTRSSISEFASGFGGVPLAERSLRIPDKRKAITAALILVLAILVAALGLVPAAVSFALGVVVSLAVRTLPPREGSTALDWPVSVLLAALIPVAGAVESTGTADLIARVLFETVAQGHPVVGLALILVVTMTL